MHPNPPIIILGSGGHAAHCVELARSCNLGPVAGCLDDDAQLHHQQVLGIPVHGEIGDLGSVAAPAAVVVAIGDPATRGRLIALVQTRGLGLISLIHPAACVAASALIGPACVIDAGVVVGARSDIGLGTIIDAGASIAHDAVVGSLVHIEAGARILPGAHIGAAARIGANAVVTRQSIVAVGARVPPGAVV